MVGAEKISVKSYHHQAVKDIGTGLRESAHTEDEIVEGIESIDNIYVVGIQWHPELEDADTSARIFESFVDECSKEA